MSEVMVGTSTYDEQRLHPLLFGMLARLDGGRIQRGVRVLVKPNLLSPAAPADAVLTHPFVVKAVVECCLEKGARVQLSDSSAIGSFGGSHPSRCAFASSPALSPANKGDRMMK